MSPTVEDSHINQVQNVRYVQDTETAGPNEFTDIVGFGNWQLRILLVLSFMSIFKAANHLGNGFLAFPKDFWCVEPYFFNGTEEKRWSNDATEGEPLVINQCEMYSMNNTEGGTRTPCESWEFAPGYKSIIEKWDLVCSNDWLISTAQSIYMIGFLFAVLISGQMSDICGRRPTSIFLVFVILIAGFATAFCTSFACFVVARFFVAVGQSGLHIVLFVLVFELIGSKNRARDSILTGFGWAIGCILLPVLAWQLQNWQYVQLALTIPCLSYISFYWLLPESPRWLLCRNKMNEAVEVMRIATSVNKRPVRDDLELQAQNLCTQIFKNKEDEAQSRATVLDLLRTSNLRKKTLSLYFIWMSISFMYYGLALNTNELHGDPFWNAFLGGLMEFPAIVFCVVTIDRFGRRPPFIFSLTVGGFACLGCIFLKKEWGWITTSLALCGRLFAASCFNFVFVYSAEIFPTVARNVGVGSSSTVSRIGAALAPFSKELIRQESIQRFSTGFHFKTCGMSCSGNLIRGMTVNKATVCLLLSKRKPRFLNSIQIFYVLYINSILIYSKFNIWELQISIC